MDSEPQDVSSGGPRVHDAVKDRPRDSRTSGSGNGLRRFLRNSLGMVLLALPIAGMFRVWEDARGAPLAVLNGSLFRTPWHNVHAGFCLDQPTIGKWYFWSTVFAVLWAVIGLIVRRRRIFTRDSRIVSGVCICLVVGEGLLFGLVHTVPVCWTLQYIGTGVTVRRLVALAWGMAVYALLAGTTVTLARHAAAPAQQ